MSRSQPSPAEANVIGVEPRLRLLHDEVDLSLPGHGEWWRLTTSEHGLTEQASLGHTDEAIATSLALPITSLPEVMANVEWKYGVKNLPAAIHRAIIKGNLPVERDEAPMLLDDYGQKLLSLLAAGRPNKYIAAHLKRQAGEVRRDKELLCLALGATGSRHLIRRAHETGNL